MWFFGLLVILKQTVVASTSTGSIRLADGSCSAGGRLEIYYGGKWGTVCDDYFDSDDATVACRQLGYRRGVSLGSSVSDGHGKIWLDDVNCVGTETTIATCPHRPWGKHDCGNYEDVGVRCFEDSCVSVNGEWSDWVAWTTCTITCGGGIQHKSRKCNNPPPRDGGSDCQGESMDYRVCNTISCLAPVNGGWSNWHAWHTCTTTCGCGFQNRLRDCNHPSPRNDGNYCDGVSMETRVCNSVRCMDFAGKLKVTYMRMRYHVNRTKR